MSEELRSATLEGSGDSVAPARRNPFPGPRPYRREEAATFFGRDDLTRQLSYSIGARTVTTLYGPSGAGKSSLMGAGVIPRMVRDSRYRVAHVDTWPRAHQARPWLVGIADKQWEVYEEASSLEVVIREAASQSGRPLLLFLDQLEQLLLAERTDELDDVMAAIQSVATTPVPGLRGLVIVLGVQEEYLGPFRDRARNYPALLDTGFRIGRMTVNEMTEAILKTASSGSPSWPVADAYVRALLRQVVEAKSTELEQGGLGQPDSNTTTRGDREVEAAYAQIVFRALWDRSERFAEPSSDVPSARQIVQSYLEETLEGLGQDRDRARALLEEHLVDDVGNKTLLTTEEAHGLLPSGTGSDILAKLVGAAILRAEEMDHGSGQYFQLGHAWLASWVFERKRRRIKEQRSAEQLARLSAEETRRRFYQIAAVAMFVLVVALSAVTAVALQARSAAAEARLDATIRLVKEIAARLSAEESRAHARDLVLLGAVQGELVRNQPDMAARLLLEVKNKGTHSWKDLALRALSRTVFPLTLRGDDSLVLDAMFSFDEKSVVTIANNGSARLWDVATGASRELQSNDVLTGAVAAAANVLVTSARDGSVRVWRLDDPLLASVAWAHGTHLRSAAVSQDGKVVVSFGSDKVVRWELDSGNRRVLLEAGANQTLGVGALSPDHKRVAVARMSHASSGDSWRLIVVESDDPNIVRSFEAVGKVEEVMWSADSSRAAVRVKTTDGTSPFFANVKESQTGSPRLSSIGASAAGSMDVTKWASSVEFAPDGAIIVARLDGSVDRCPPMYEECGSALVARKAPVFGASASGDGQVVVALSDGAAYVFDPEGGVVANLLGHEGAVQRARFSRSSKLVATASDDGTARIWQLARRAVPESAAVGDDVLKSLLSDHGTHLAVLRATSIELWSLWPELSRVQTDPVPADLATDCRLHAVAPGGVVYSCGDRVRLLLRGAPNVELEKRFTLQAASFSPDENRALLTTKEGAWVLDLGGAADSNPPLAKLLDSKEAPDAAFTPDGKRILIAIDGRVHSFSVYGQGEELLPIELTNALTAAAPTPDGAHLVAAEAGAFRLSPTPPASVAWSWHPGTFRAFAPDSSVFLTTPNSLTMPDRVDVWDAATRRQAMSLVDGAVIDVRLSADGSELVTSGAADQRRIRVSRWPITTEGLRLKLEGAVLECLRPELRGAYLEETQTTAQKTYDECERAAGRTPLSRTVSLHESTPPTAN